jgi:hypothetical protein
MQKSLLKSRPDSLAQLAEQSTNCTMFEVSNVVAVGSRGKSSLATIVQFEEQSTND